MKRHVGIALFLAGTAAYGAPLSVNDRLTFQQAAPTTTFSSRVTISPTVQVIQPTLSVQTSVLSVQSLQTIQAIKTPTLQTVSTPTFTIKTQYLQDAPIPALTKLQSTQALDTSKVGPIKVSLPEQISELTLDAASLATVAIQPAKAVASTLLDPADAARLAVNNENVVPAARVALDGQLVVLLDEQEVRRRAV